MSLILKFLDLRFVNTDIPINFWKFNAVPLKTIVMAQTQVFLDVEVTWRDLLTWPGIAFDWNFQRECVEDAWWSMQKGRHAAPPFFRYSRKTWERSLLSAPPVAAPFKIDKTKNDQKSVDLWIDQENRAKESIAPPLFRFLAKSGFDISNQNERLH